MVMDQITGIVMAYLLDRVVLLLLFILALPTVIFIILTFLDNCWSYAFRRVVKDGGYLMARRSHSADEIGAGKTSARWWLPHFLHMDRSGRVTQYRPTEDELDIQNSRWWRFWMRLPHFSGEVVTGDDKKEQLTKVKP